MAQAQTDLTVRIDSDLKTSGEALFQSLGMNFSTAVNVFVKQSVRLGKIPFEVDTDIEDAYIAEWEAEDPYFNRAMQRELRSRAKNMDAGINCAYHELIETD
jgi:DNA-damage-inducible protein J